MSEFTSLIQSVEQKYSMPSGLLSAQLMAESGMNPTAYNPAAGGAYGIAQFQPATAEQFGVNPLDPASSINGAGQYMSQLYQSTGSWVSALQKYGTLPSDLGNLNQGQQTVYSIASNADAQAAGSGSYNPLSGADTAFPAPGVGQSATLSGTVAAGAQAAHSLASPSTWFGFLSDWGLRIVVGIVAILCIGIGSAALAFKSEAVQSTIRTVKEVVE